MSWLSVCLWLSLFALTATKTKAYPDAAATAAVAAVGVVAAAAAVGVAAATAAAVGVAADTAAAVGVAAAAAAGFCSCYERATLNSRKPLTPNPKP